MRRGLVIACFEHALQLLQERFAAHAPETAERAIQLHVFAQVPEEVMLGLAVLTFVGAVKLGVMVIDKKFGRVEIALAELMSERKREQAHVCHPGYP